MKTRFYSKKFSPQKWILLYVLHNGPVTTCMWHVCGRKLNILQYVDLDPTSQCRVLCLTFLVCSFKFRDKNLLPWKLHNDKMHDARWQFLSCKLHNSKPVSCILLPCKLHARKFLSGKLHEKILLHCKQKDGKLVPYKLHHIKLLSFTLHNTKLVLCKLHDNKLLSFKLYDKKPRCCKLYAGKWLYCKLHDEKSLRLGYRRYIVEKCCKIVLVEF